MPTFMRNIRSLLKRSNQEKIAIVGGGITGIISARELSKAGYSVDLYEARKQLAGTLKDFEHDGEIFLNSTQYLKANSSWYSDFEDDIMLRFKHEYASYTDIFGHKSFANDFAGPVCDVDISPDLDALPPSCSFMSIKDRLDAYPKCISENLSTWLERCGLDLTKTHHSALDGLQLSRVFPRSNIDHIRVLKETNKLASDLYGLPRHILNLPDLHSMIPLNGYNELFDYFQSTADDFAIYRRENVRLKLDDNKHKLIGKNGNIDTYDRIIWTANPSDYLSKRYEQNVDSAKIKMNITVGLLKQCVEKPFYIQVFSSVSSVLRIYIYNMHGKGKVTIERMDEDVGEGQILEHCNNILSYFGHPQILSLIHSFPQNRFFTYSIDDFELIEKVFKKPYYDLIMSDFRKFGRDAKIQSILDRFIG